jgi:N-acetylmuramoyl-L-alanine amidase
MPTHVVRQGECLSSIAKKHGIADWHTIYDDPQNADFKRKRPNPNLICPGDILFVPDLTQKEETGATETRHTFRLVGKPVKLRVLVQDVDGQPLAGKKYELRVGAKVQTGVTGSDGLAEVEAPADAEVGELVVWADDQAPDQPDRLTLKIGHLDPVEELSGVQARLNNLGYDCGPADGVDGERTQAAVKAFQGDQGLKVDGIAGPQTQAKLKQVYGC